MANFVMPSGRPNPYTAPPEQPNPWGSAGDPTKPIQGQYSGSAEDAKKGLLYAGKKRAGRDLTQDEQNSIYDNAQKLGYKGGNVDTNLYNQSLEYMYKLLGPEQPKPGPGAQLDSTGLGVHNAQDQWRQQAPVAGVPNSFRGSNPYAGQQQALMSKILADPHTMSQQWQDQVSESQKESAQRMMAQANAQGQQSLAGKGFAAGGGAQQQMQNQNQQQMISQLLAGRRDTATQAAQQNRADEYNALNNSAQLNQQDWNGQMQLAGMNLGQMNQNRSQNLQDFLGLHGADMDMLRLQQGDNQFNSQFGLDFLRYLAQKEQFGQSLGENARQFNGQMGLNWANLSAQQQQQLMARILGV